MIRAAGLAIGRNECCAQTVRAEGKEILHYIIEGKPVAYDHTIQQLILLDEPSKEQQSNSKSDGFLSRLFHKKKS